MGNEYSSFERIPFAAPPVGNRRFGPPQPHQPWEGKYCLNYQQQQQQQQQQNKTSKTRKKVDQSTLTGSLYFFLALDQ